MSAFNRAALPGWPSYADDRGMKLVGRGRWRTTRCDLHGGSDSLRVNTESGGWCCMACGAHGGDVLSHYMQITDADFREGALALGAWDQTKDRHTEREARTLAPRDAMEVIARELGVAVVVISDARSGLVPSDADWRRFLVAAGTVEKLVMEFQIMNQMPDIKRIDAAAARLDVATTGPVAPPVFTRERPNVLREVEDFLSRFVAYPSEAARVAHVLWIGHAHLMECWESTPRIAFLSPEPGSGKSRALEASELLVPLPVQAVNVTPAYLFRKVGSEDGRPTILYDEIDTVFGPKAKENEEIRGLLNAGHRRSGVAGRCVVRGKQVFTEEIPAYCAVALAGLGGLPDTILSRSVIVRMRRRAPSEQIEPFRRRVHEAAGDAIRSRLVDWAIRVQPEIGNPWPAIPASIVDRNADIWEALLAVADAAGGDWPERARVAAVALVAESKGSTPSLGVRLLEDLRFVFGDREHMATEDIIKGLCQIDEAPWGDIRGKAIDSRGLANRLRGYGVTSKNLRIGAHIVKGYARTDLYDPWSRYLSPVGPPPYGSATSATAATSSGGDQGSVAHVAHVADSMGDGPTAAAAAVQAAAAHRGWTEVEVAAWMADAAENPAAVLDLLDDY